MGPPVPGNIPWIAICQWADRHRMTPGEHTMLDRVLMAMDRTYHDWWTTKQKAAGALA